MNSFSSRKVLIAFLGSPGDVDKERKAAWDAVESVNRILKGIGWEVDLRGWEDTLPGHGRPQEIINADIHACSLFIGLLHARWGSATGKHSSGFEEEFRLALDLRQKRGSPEIWLFFKKVPSPQLKDPGKQLKRVQAFRSEVASKREVLFKDIQSTAEWTELLPEMLLKYVLGLHQQHLNQSAAALVPTATSKETENAPLAPREVQPLPAQLSEALTSANAAGSRTLSLLQSIRIHLYSTANMSMYTTVLLGVHEINILYKHRAELQSTSTEKYHLYESLIGNPGDVAPGWYWFRDQDEAKAKGLLLHFAILSAFVLARKQAVKLLSSFRTPPDFKDASENISLHRFLDDSSPEVRKEKLEYLCGIPSDGMLEQIESQCALPEGGYPDDVKEALSIAKAKFKADQKLKEILAGGQPPHKKILQSLQNQADSLEGTDLQSLITHTDPVLRQFAAELLEKRRVFTLETAGKLSRDQAVKVRAVGYREMVRLGAELSLEDIDYEVRDHIGDALVDYFARLPFDRIESHIDIYSLDGAFAYRALGRQYFDQASEQIRSDLNDGFEAKRAEWWKKMEKLKAQYPVEIPRELDNVIKSYKKDGDLDRMLRGRFIAAALRSLIQYGSPGDIELGRRYLTWDSDDTRLAAVDFLEKFGDESDSDRLVALVEDRWSTREATARAAVKLARRSDEKLYSLLDSNNQMVARYAIESLEKRDLPATQERLIGLLHHDSVEVRQDAVVGLVRLCDHSTLESILISYLDNTKYYYNVICWLDRLLYSPQPIRQYYQTSLVRQNSIGTSSVLDD